MNWTKGLPPEDCRTYIVSDGEQIAKAFHYIGEVRGFRTREILTEFVKFWMPVPEKWNMFEVPEGISIVLTTDGRNVSRYEFTKFGFVLVEDSFDTFGGARFDGVILGWIEIPEYPA